MVLRPQLKVPEVALTNAVFARPVKCGDILKDLKVLIVSWRSFAYCAVRELGNYFLLMIILALSPNAILKYTREC
jgi:hypothetical protein